LRLLFGVESGQATFWSVSSDEWQGIAERGYGAWSRGDLDGFLAALAPDIEFSTAGVFPGIEDAYRGHEGVRAFWFQMREPFESFSIEPVRIERHGDDAAVIDIHFRAIGKGSAVPVELDFFHAARLRDGLVTELSSHSSREEALTALSAA
jgi:ketosteroid isomerase-like protein